MPKSHRAKLENLIMISKGFIDVYIAHLGNAIPLLIPQNIVLECIASESTVESILWQGQEIPIYSVCKQQDKSGFILIIESHHVFERFGFFVLLQPESKRVRVSEMRDANIEKKDDMVLEWVYIDDRLYQIPNLEVYEKLCYGSKLT